MAQSGEATSEAVDAPLADLRRGAAEWARTGFLRRGQVLAECLAAVRDAAPAWVATCCAAKHAGMAPAAAAAAAGEEIATGPLATARHLRLLLAAQRHLAAGRLPPLPRSTRAAWRDGRAVPVFPTAEMLDRWLYRGFAAVVRVAGDDPLQVPPPLGGTGEVALVLGAGNVSGLPISDSLHQIFQASRAVLLKLSPLHADLLPVFERALHPLLRCGVLRIVCGPAGLGAAAARHALVDAVHLTGSAATAAAVAECAPHKPLTTELGGVTPVLVLPGRFAARDLATQAQNVATMLVHNASNNCVAAQLLLTWRGWPQRTAFLDAIDGVLAAIPARPAWYPGTADRLRRCCPEVAMVGGKVPWTLLRDLPVLRSNDGHAPPLLRQEVFAGVLAEVALPGRDAADFQANATAFANDEVAGDLGATLLAPRDADPTFAVDHLRYGTIGINHWCALGYAWMSPPWGGHPGGASGEGFVHNTFLLASPRKTIVTGPFRPWPTPPWFATHPRGTAILRSLCRYYLGEGWHHALWAALGSVRLP